MDILNLAELVSAPLILLERTKGWKRRVLTFFYLLIALAMGGYGWHSLCLWRLPNAPEPFDLVKYGRVDVADADNAMVAYRAVFAKFGDLQGGGYKVARIKRGMCPTGRWPTRKSAAGLKITANELEAWIPANYRPDSLLVQPEELRMRLRPGAGASESVPTSGSPSSKVPASSKPATFRCSGGCPVGTLASRHVGRHGGTISAP